MEMIQKENYVRNATVVKVIDGDTVDLDVDLGFSIRQTDRFRLTGIDAPEKNTEAGMVTKQWLENTLPPGKEVVIATSKDKKEKYGRYLAVIYTKEFETSVNGVLIQNGLAKAYFGGKRTQ